MKCLALLVAKITMLQFAFCRGYLVSKPGEAATEPELGASSLYLKWELGAKQCVRGCWCATDLETEKDFTEERLSEGLIQSGWGGPMGFCHLLLPLHSLLLTVTALLSFTPQPFLSWLLHES